MPHPLKLLVVEDNPDDFALLEDALRRAGLDADCWRVDTLGGLEEALTGARWSLMLADFGTAGIDFRDALRLVRERNGDLPVVLVTGAIGEELAVDMLNAGARDFVLKDNLARLPVVIRRCLDEVAERRRRSEAEAALAANERKFRAYFEQAPILALVLDRQGRIVEANPATIDCLGYAADEIGRLDLFSIVGAAFLDAVRDFFSTLLADGVCESEFRLRGRDGRLTWVGARGALLDTEHVVYAKNIEERKQGEAALAEREAQYRAVIETSGDGFWMLDETGQLLAVNEAYVRRSGYSREALLGMSIARLEAQESHSEVLAHIGKVRREGSDRFESYHRARSGEIWPVEVNAAYWESAGGRFFVFLRDLSERKRTEMALQNAQEELEEQMHFHVARQTVAAIAHELNQPLVAVSSYAEAALRLLRAGNPQPEKLQYALESSAEQAQRAGQVVRELLSCLNQGEIKAESIDLNEVVCGVMQRVALDRRDAFRTHLDLEPDLTPVSANRLQVEKVLTNLVENGIEAMHEAGVDEGAIAITVRTRDGGDMAQVTVRDTGPGIDESILHRIFDPFFTTKQRKGLGMGLPISRAILEENGGRLWAESEPGAGASFHFVLPFAR